MSKSRSAVTSGSPLHRRPYGRHDPWKPDSGPTSTISLVFRAAPSTTERHETSDPVRSDAVKAQFQCVLTPRETPVPWRPATDFMINSRQLTGMSDIRACARLAGTYGFTRSGSGPPRNAIVVASAAWHPGLRMPLRTAVPVRAVVRKQIVGQFRSRHVRPGHRPVPTVSSACSDRAIRRFRCPRRRGVPLGAGLGSIGTRGKVRR